MDNASFQLFFQLGFDVLKLDKSLEWGLDTTDRTMQVICSLVRLCDDLGIETVAEGIEDRRAAPGLAGGKAARACRATGWDGRSLSRSSSDGFSLP
ncbi:MAG: EAL domain-containing protein [Gordonibacter pamelaeae]